MLVFLWQVAESRQFDQIRAGSPQQHENGNDFKVISPLSRVYSVKSEDSKGCNTFLNKFFFFFVSVNIHKSICDIVCSLSPAVFISVSHFRFQFQFKDREITRCQFISSYNLLQSIGL